MSIMVIDGKPAAVREMATTLRNAQISAGKGALLLLRPGTQKGEEHELRHQVEKILAGHTFEYAKENMNRTELVEEVEYNARDEVASVKEVKKPVRDRMFKPNVMVIVPKAEEDLLPKLDALLPGFTKHFGPISRMTV